MNSAKPLLVTVDGFDGTGKTTLINKIINLYKGKYSIYSEKLVQVTINTYREYTNWTNDHFRLIPEEARLISYLWEAHIRLELLKNTYSAYDIVLFDRWIYTNISSYSDPNFLKSNEFLRFLINKIHKPDILIFIKAKFETILRQLKEKDDWMLWTYTKDELQDRVVSYYENYSRLLACLSGVQVIVLDSEQSLENKLYILENEISSRIRSEQHG